MALGGVFLLGGQKAESVGVLKGKGYFVLFFFLIIQTSKN